MMEKNTLLKSIDGLFSKKEGLDDLLKMSKNWDGHKRENAVRRLGMLGSPMAIPHLILRVNDWVPQVRSAALKAITMLLNPDNAMAFVISLPALYHLEKCNRSNHTELIECVEKFLMADVNKEHVVQGLEDKDVLVARACISLIIENRLLDIFYIVKAGLAHNDLIVRVKASSLMRKLDVNDQKVALELAIKDSFMPIRREAFQIQIRVGASSEFLKAFLFDRHPSIREIAIKHLLDRRVDVASIYAASLDAALLATRQKIAIWGLGEVTDRASTGKINERLVSQFSSVRKQSLITLVKLQGEIFENRLVEFLLDPSPAVCKEAARQSLKSNVIFTADKLIEVCKSSLYKHSVATCMGLSKNINKWERLLFLFQLACLKDRSELVCISEIADEVLRWNIDFNNSFSQPRSLQVEALLEVYSRCRHYLDLPTQRSLVFTFKTCGFLK
jgi:HEAT repeat protein